MHPVLAAAEANDPFNADFYIAIITVLPVLMLATPVLAAFARSFPPEMEDKWSDPFYWLVSFFYSFTPILSAVAIILDVFALLFREEGGWLQVVVLILFVPAVIFMGIIASIFLSNYDKIRQSKRKVPGRPRNLFWKKHSSVSQQDSPPGSTA
jgi:hypothetical protein